ncbi:3-phosphoglycerate kinase [Pseudomonas sp. LRF_L74]|uniref:3-phosphoglycerate kinase n=1 Tax=Pseudomonas sp. LRF_L74 TaxID=3369422 RepID=UPI003F611703
MKKTCLALLAALPLAATAYPIEVDKQLNGADLAVTAQDIDRDIAAVTLYNYGNKAAHCTASFRNGPEAPRTRKSEVQPGQTVNLTAKFSRAVIRLRVQVTCR